MLERVDYTDTFIAVAPGFAGTAVVPAERGGKPTVASATHQLLAEHPYRFTSGDVIFNVWADRQSIPKANRAGARQEFYAQPRPCLRASDLGKKFGWGIHADSDGRLALYPVGSAEYQQLEAGTGPDGEPVRVLRAMRVSR